MGGNSMKKIALVTNFNIPDKANSALTVANYLIKLGCKILVSQYSKERVLSMKKYRGDIYFLPVEKLYDEAEVVIALGGDGTIMDCAKRIAARGKPVLGINLGHLGYMAELEMSELESLSRLVDGDFEIDERAMINVEVYNSKGVKKMRASALNDAVISNGSVARIIDLELYEGGTPITAYRADGLIVSTPTGSTAYSMSAGGAIADPRVKCLCVTPICPHSLVARPLIFPENAEIEVKNICVREKSLYLTIDGRSNFELYREDVVKITKSETCAKLIRMKERSFYDRLRQKMRNNY